MTLLQAGGETVDLVVTDVVMPHRTGPELLRAAQSLDRRPRFLFTSGYADLSPTDLDVIRAADFLPKPWTAEELLVKIRTVLDRQDVA
ncbi:MAG: hypothetical protein A2W29_01005 [Gemmatimonadetes bacterium RBG_16_66_8]|nr:MAG: hypothetical protein A2W29_01005 [Gemmatimonadetes bacterium RBG_16_66_8]